MTRSANDPLRTMSTPRPALAWLLALAAAGGGIPVARAQAPSPDSTRRGPVDRAELEAFVDGVITTQMADAHVVGAQVSVVRNGVVMLSKGYGFADLARRRPVDPATTLFRPGSVTKLFTWTGVMPLVEAGGVVFAWSLSMWNLLGWRV